MCRSGSTEVNGKGPMKPGAGPGSRRTRVAAVQRFHVPPRGRTTEPAHAAGFTGACRALQCAANTRTNDESERPSVFDDDETVFAVALRSGSCGTSLAPQRQFREGSASSAQKGGIEAQRGAGLSPDSTLSRRPAPPSPLGRTGSDGDRVGAGRTRGSLRGHREHRSAPSTRSAIA